MNPDTPERQSEVEQAFLMRLHTKHGPSIPMKILEMIIDNKIPNGWIIR